MLRRLATLLVAAAAVIAGASLPATAAAQNCSCDAEIDRNDAGVIFAGRAIGLVGDLRSGPEPLDEWSFVADELYRGDVALEQFVATAKDGCDRIEFERDQTYVVFGEQIPKAELPETVLELSVIRAHACATTTDVGVIDELGLTAIVADPAPPAVAGAGKFQPQTADDDLDLVTALVFGGGFVVVTALVFWLWRKPASDDDVARA